MRTLDCLDVEVECLLGRVLADGGVARVGERAGLAVAEAGDIVFVAAEILLFFSSEGVDLLGLDVVQVIRGRGVCIL